MLGVAVESGGLVVRECRGVYAVVNVLVMMDEREIGPQCGGRPWVKKAEECERVKLCVDGRLV